jgi:hypothetical protein
VIIFFVGEVLLSRLLFSGHIRNHPYSEFRFEDFSILLAKRKSGD